MKIYISGALKASRDLTRARALYESAAIIVKEAGASPYLPHQHTDPKRNADASAASVFRRDLEALKSSKGVIAFLREPSLGVGAELAICAQAEIPLLGLYSQGDEVSRFAIGLIYEAGFRLDCYSDTFELDRAIRLFISDLRLKSALEGAMHGKTGT